MFNLRLCNAVTIQYSLLKYGYVHFRGKCYEYFSPHCCKCNSCVCIAAIRCCNACHGPDGDSVYSGSEHRQFNSPRLVKREASFPNPRRALIGSNQLWRVNDSPYCREYIYIHICVNDSPDYEEYKYMCVCVYLLAISSKQHYKIKTGQQLLLIRHHQWIFGDIQVLRFSFPVIYKMACDLLKFSMFNYYQSITLTDSPL